MLSMMAEMFAQCISDVETGQANCEAAAGGCSANSGSVVSASNDIDYTGGSCQTLFKQVTALHADSENCVHCATEFTWTSGGKKKGLKLGSMCDKKNDKICYPNKAPNGAVCSADMIEKMYSGPSNYFGSLATKCYRQKASAAGNWPAAPTITSGTITACDKLNQFVTGDVQWYALAFAILLVLVSLAMVKFWFIVTIAKLLLYAYVLFEGVLGVSATSGGLYLLTLKYLPLWLKLGTLGIGLYLLLVAGTFYKGMTAMPRMLYLSFLAAAILAIVTFCVGISLSLDVGGICKDVEERFDNAEDLGLTHDDIQEAKKGTTEAQTALVVVMFLVFGAAASSVILSLRMKDDLQQKKKEHQEKLELTEIKKDEKKEKEKDAWAEKMKKQVEKEEKKARKKGRS